MAADEAQCVAITESGDRCSRPARDGAFCYQHTAEDETIDDVDVGEAAETEPSGGNGQRDNAMASDTNLETGEIGEIRSDVQTIAEEVVGYPLSGITSINRDDDSWTVAIEVVERKSIPDTQDILGRYELTLDADDRTVTGYRRTHRYRRDDVEQDV